MYLIFVLFAASAVFLVGHWDAVVDPYCINDDVRQQLFWMQKWYDEDLFPDDFLTLYARYYVPWGVKAVYRLGQPFITPVQFSKVVTAILFVVTACFIFGLALEFKDEVAAVVIVCFYFFFTGFLRKISGGLSQGFAFPLLAAYLFFLARENLLASALTIMCASVLNPYIFVLCSVTHAFYLAANCGGVLLQKLRRKHSVAPIRQEGPPEESATAGSPNGGLSEVSVGKLLLLNVPILLGALLMSLKYIFLKPDGLGDLVTWSQMVGKIEYTAVGRYEILPVPPIWFEFARPWLDVLPFEEWGPIWGWIGVAFVVAVAVYAWTRRNIALYARCFRVFAYLMPASIIMWGVADLVLMRLFLPERYIEFSLTIFYCLFTGLSATLAMERLGLKRIIFPWLVVGTIFVAALRSHQVGIYDYSQYRDLYHFLRHTPKATLIAGHPQLMDPFPTFSHRKAFLTYEISHTWIDHYWEVIKTRTFDFFKAYYAEDPAELRQFCQYYGIDYLLVRDEDFSREVLENGRIYFEPFGSWVRELVKNRSHFAALDRKSFPVVYRSDGVRVLKMK
jgi:hypothetical protein